MGFFKVPLSRPVTHYHNDRDVVSSAPITGALYQGSRNGRGGAATQQYLDVLNAQFLVQTVGAQQIAVPVMDFLDLGVDVKLIRAAYGSRNHVSRRMVFRLGPVRWAAAISNR